MAEPTIWRYVLKSEPERRNGWSEGWGIFILDSTGYFSCVTDFGNYVYLWTHHGCPDFRQFLVGLENDYLIRKLAPERDYDGEKTLANIKQHIIEGRRDGTYTKEEAREHWTDLSWVEPWSEYSCNEWLRDSKINDASELIVRVPNRQATHFCKRVWPRFVELLKKDLGQ